MMHKYLFNGLLVIIIFITGCTEKTFTKIESRPLSITSLEYPTITNAREFSRISSGVPTYNTNGIIPTFEIVTVKDGHGQPLGQDYLKDVTITNVTETKDTTVHLDDGRVVESSVPFAREVGEVVIQDGNMFGPGVYTFTVKMTIERDGESLSETFDDVFKLQVGPQLVEDLLYSPLAQNLIPSINNSTHKPYILSGNDNVQFALGDNEDKLKIDPATGVISINEGYSFTENDTIYPTVIVTSNISEEASIFQGDDFLMLVLSHTPVTLPRKVVNIFYPTFQAENTLYGYKVDVIEQGDMALDKIWTKVAPSPMAAADRPADLTALSGIQTNLVVGGASAPHESDVIVNSQDLSIYKIGFDLSAIFYIQNNFVLYLPDGRTPTNLEIYVSTDYDGDNNAATWTRVNGDVKCLIQGTQNEFIGTPYPGQNNGPDPDGVKDVSKNNYGKWVKCELDLNPYKDASKFTLKFKLASYFTGEIGPGIDGSRAGRWLISDVHYLAKEEG